MLFEIDFLDATVHLFSKCLWHGKLAQLTQYFSGLVYRTEQFRKLFRAETRLCLIYQSYNFYSSFPIEFIRNLF